MWACAGVNKKGGTDEEKGNDSVDGRGRIRMTERAMNDKYPTIIEPRGGKDREKRWEGKIDRERGKEKEGEKGNTERGKGDGYKTIAVQPT